MPTDAFALTPDPKALYPSPQHQRTLTELHAGVESGRGLMVLLGEIGTGKTTLAHALLGMLDASIRSAYVSETLGSFAGLLRQAAADFGIDATGDDEEALRDRLRAFLQECAASRARAVLVIDEAQHLTDDALEKLRLLSDFDTYDAKVLQLILIGPLGLAEQLANPALRALRERVAVFARLEPLDHDESKRYIEYRLARAGSSPKLFTTAAVDAAARIASGNPRRLNIACHDAIAAATRTGTTRVSTRVVRRAAHARVAGAAGGRRASSFAGRPLAAVVVGLAIAGIVALLPGYGPQTEASRLVGATPLAARETAPAEEIVPSEEIVAAEEILPAEGPVTEEEIVRAPEPAPSEPREREIRVPLGMGLRALAREHYGSDARDVLERIARANPEIVDMNRINAGQTLRLPGLFDE